MFVRGVMVLRSEQFAVLNETQTIGEFIVKRARGHIVFFGKLIDPARAGGARDFLDMFDELCPDAFAARPGAGSGSSVKVFLAWTTPEIRQAILVDNPSRLYDFRDTGAPSCD